MRKLIALFSITVLGIIMTGCGAASAPVMAALPPAPIPVMVSPSSVSLQGECSQGVQQFTASVANHPLAKFGWSASAGTIGKLTGLYTAPRTSTAMTVTITAEWLNHNDAGTATVSVVVPPPLTIVTTSLPNAQVSQPYSAQMVATGGCLPYTWSATGLPPGLSIDANTGIISGTPQLAGAFKTAGGTLLVKR